jgi:acetoacetyl-CoA synthetase
MAVEAFDDGRTPLSAGQRPARRAGLHEAVPSMPIGFLNDPGDVKYQAAYFEQFPGVWCHGDFIEITGAWRHDHLRQVRRRAQSGRRADRHRGDLPAGRAARRVVESLVIGQEWDHDVRVVLFVRLRDGMTLDDALVAKIKQQIRTNTTPRHVPAKVFRSRHPATKSNKIVELAVRNVVHGRPVKNVEALANPEALEHYRDRPELST